jgi:hypothetical protein
MFFLQGIPCFNSSPHLVGGLTILKNMKVNGKDDIPHIMENKKCLKPPTSTISWYIQFHRIFHYKPSILGTPFMETPYCWAVKGDDFPNPLMIRSLKIDYQSLKIPLMSESVLLSPIISLLGMPCFFRLESPSFSPSSAAATALGAAGVGRPEARPSQRGRLGHLRTGQRGALNGSGLGFS